MWDSLYVEKYEYLWDRVVVIVLKSHSALLRSIVIVLMIVAAKTNWQEKHVKYGFKITSLLPNQKSEFKILLG